MYQMHVLKMMHADPHPGNFIINENQLGVIDFGCIKKIPENFYASYFELANHEVLDNPERVDELFWKLEIYKKADPEADRIIVKKMFTDLIRLLSIPFNQDSFDFGDDTYFKKIYEMGDEIARNPDMNRLQARGSRHFIYFNRTFFGLYNILNAIKAKITITDTDRILKLAS
jgi:predicted unusual protein kinase regulating ubiquinone biosynthesis (AarF/ABC1/UbiB family)